MTQLPFGISPSHLHAVWAYRGFILGSVKREFQSRYQNSLLGAAWTVLNPLAMILIYTVVFSQVMRARLPGAENVYSYSIYLCAGVLTWGLFAEITGRSLNVFIEHANLLKKISFPRLCLPTVVVLNAGLNFAIIFGLFTVFLLISGNFPGLAFLALIPLLAILVAFSIGLGITLGILNVFFRDVGQLFGVLLQFWFWLTPIVYPASVLPEWARPIIGLNPLANLMEGYQTILVKGQWPHWRSLWLVTMLSVLLCALGIWLFRKHAGEMVDEL
ncbi:MAG: ABC transporter permease [Deltaproteobacteria bacterium]